MAQAAMGPFWLDEFYRKQAQTKATTGQDPNLASVYGAVYGAQNARYQNAQEMARIQTQKDQEAARLAQNQSQFGVTSDLEKQRLAQNQAQFGVTSDLAKQKLEQDQWAGVSSGATNLALTGAIFNQMTATSANAAMGTPAQPGVIERGYEYVAGPSATPAYTTAAGEIAAYEAGGSGMTVAETTGAEAFGYGAGTTGVTAGMVAWPAAAGYAGAKYGPWKEESGRMATFGMGGERERKIGGGALRGGGAGAIVGTIVLPGLGTAVGFVVGAFVGGLTEATDVICTEMLKQNLITKELFDITREYKFDWATYWGYRLWADPIVIKMSKSRRFARLVALFGVPYMKELSHRIDPQRKGSRFGSLMLQFGVPFCRWNFNRVARKYRKLSAWHQGIRENCNG